MGSGWHEWPLVLFTVLGQCVVGATLFSGLVWLELADQREARQRLVRSMFFIWLLMGIGCGAVTTGSVVLCSKWMRPERFTATAASLFALSQIGYIMSTSPMALLVNGIGWRHAFFVLALGALCLALAHGILLRETPWAVPERATSGRTMRDVLRGSLSILSDQRLWPVYAMAFVSYASGFSIIGVWGGVYFFKVYDLSLVDRGNILLVMVGAYAVGLCLFGWVGQRVGSQKRTVIAGMSLACVVLVVLAICPALPLVAAVVLFVVLGAASGSSSLLTMHGYAFYPADAIGRGMTMLNIVVLAGSLAFHVVTGLLMDAMTALGMPAAVSFRILFLVHAACLLAGLHVYRRAVDRPESARM